MKRWIEPAPIVPSDVVRLAVGGHPLVAETLARRGITTLSDALAFLDPTRYTPASPLDLPDMQIAVSRIEAALTQGEPIAVWGDFDVDGQTSTALLVSALRTLGGDVRYYIPHREREGHGVHIAALERLIDAGARLIVTCDTGISAHAALDHARDRGVDVVVTDHHALPETLPHALALVNPKRLPDGAKHPLWTLPGVGVAYKLIEALAAKMSRADDMPELLDLVALGIVADVADQVGDARWLLQRGLEALRTTSRIGLRAMFENAEIDGERISEEHIAFQLAPRLNALGRLDDANHAVELLTTDDVEQARLIAATLESLNAERRFMTTQIVESAQAQIERDPSLAEMGALVLSNPNWHPGIVGIVAARLVELYDRPAVLLVQGADGIARGSARSLDGIDISAAIAACDEILLGWGGHTGAAGMQLSTVRIGDFRRMLSGAVKAQRGIAPEPSLTIDGYVTLPELTLDFIADLERLAPFGAGNPPLTLAARNLRVARHGAVGRNGEHRQLTLEDANGHTARAIWWRGGDEPVPDERFDLALVVRTQDYRGKAQVQIEWIDARPAAGAVSLVKPSLEVIDRREIRTVAAIRDEIAALRAEHAAIQVWAEGELAGQIDGSRRRMQLERGQVLALVHAPPGNAELQLIMTRCDPRRVVVFGADAQADDARAFLTRLAALVNYAIRQKGGRAALDDLAAATAQRVTTVRAGLEWLADQGAISVTFDGESVHLTSSAGERGSADHARLRALIEESKTFRHYWNLMRTANLRTLMTTK